MKTAYRFIAMLSMLGTLIGIASGCDSLPFGRPTLIPSITPTPLPTLPTDPLTPEQILSVAIDRVDRQSSYSYSYVITAELSELGLSIKDTGVGAVINPDQRYEKINSSVNGESINTEEMAIGNDQYTRESAIGPWARLPTPEVPEELEQRVYSVDIFEKATNITLIGEEKLNQAIDCYHIQLELDTAEFMDEEDNSLSYTSPTFLSNLWISKADLLLRRWEFTIPAMIENQTFNMTGSYDFFSFNQPVSIPTPFFSP